MKKTLLSILVVAVVVGGGSFYGGMKYAQSTRPNFASRNLGGQQSGVANLGGFGNRGGGSGFANGEIIAKDEKSITVKLQDGGSKIVFYSGGTEISKFAAGAAGDLEVGKTVMVNGSANQDGSITAKSIQIRPVMPTPAPTGK